MSVIRSYHSEAVLKSAIYKWQLETKDKETGWKVEAGASRSLVRLLDFELRIAFVVDTHCRGHEDSVALYLEGGRRGF